MAIIVERESSRGKMRGWRGYDDGYVLPTLRTPPPRDHVKRQMGALFVCNGTDLLINALPQNPHMVFHEQQERKTGEFKLGGSM